MQRLHLECTKIISIRKLQSQNLELVALTSNEFALFLQLSFTYRLKSIQKLDRTKSPLIKSSRLEKRNSSINPTELQNTVIKEKITSTTNISSIRYSKHSHPANKRLSESKPAVDSKKSELNNHLSENTQKPQNNLLETGEYYNKDLAFSKPKTARKKLITDFSIQIPKEDYSPSGQKGSVDLK